MYRLGKSLFIRYVVVLLLAMAWATPTYGATLHAFIVADTRDESIGTGIVLDRELVHEEIVRIALYADLDLSEVILDGGEYDPVLVLSAIDEMVTEPDDVVVYFQCSHGFRTPSMVGRWPALFFGWHQCALRMEDVVNRLRAKPHRFTLVVADVCNNCIHEGHAPRLLTMFAPLADYHLKMMYRKLYRDSRGLVVASGAKPGQYAWIDLDTGSFFTLNFLNSFKECARRKIYDWSAVFQSASECTLGWCRSIEGLSHQEPQFSVELH